MQDQGYDLNTARHYAAFRPPLHAGLLAIGLRKELFHQALDVGCGTGASTHVLSRWCRQVTGTDPSAAMIDLAQPGGGVSFRHQPGEKIDSGLEQNAFDLVSFAGSLSYLENQAVLASLKRLLLPGGAVVVYDFDVLLQPVFGRLGVLIPKSDYNHAKNLHSCPECFLSLEDSYTGETAFSLTNIQLAHLLYSVTDWRIGPLAEYSFTGLVNLLPAMTTLKAKTWLTRYAV